MLPPRIPHPLTRRSSTKAESKRWHRASAHVAMVRAVGICAATGRCCAVEAHHLMRGVNRGLGWRAAGRYTIPVSPEIHAEITPEGDPEAILMERYGLDARALADALWAARGDAEAMERAVLRAAQEAVHRQGTSWGWAA